MAERPTRPVGLRLRPSEHRTLLFFGDLIASAIAGVGAYYTWWGYSLYKLVASGINISRAKFFPSTDVPFWFYLLPIVWVLLLVDLYDPHSAANRRRTSRGISIAAFVGLVLYSLFFLLYSAPEELPRIIVGAFLFYSSLLTLGWRQLYIRLYTSSGMQRRILVIGAGKAGPACIERSVRRPSSSSASWTMTATRSGGISRATRSSATAIRCCKSSKTSAFPTW